MSFKTLYFLRHAKATPQEGAGDDHERPLTERGERDATALGQFMRKENITPALTLCSTSLRTRQTLHLLEVAMDRPLKAQMVAKLYLATPKDVLAEIEALEDAPVRSLMIIGHNPTLHQLAAALTAEGDEKLLDELSRRFPTCALAEIQYPAVEWSEVDSRQGTLKRFVMPGGMGD